MLREALTVSQKLQLLSPGANAGVSLFAQVDLNRSFLSLVNSKAPTHQMVRSWNSAAAPLEGWPRIYLQTRNAPPHGVRRERVCPAARARQVPSRSV